MSPKLTTSRSVFAGKCTIAILLTLLAFSPLLHAQAEQPLTWLEDLTVLDNASSKTSMEQQKTVSNIRSQIENWLKVHPESNIKMPPGPGPQWTAEEASTQIGLLRETVASILKQDPDRPFHLGVEEVDVTAAMSPLSPVAESIDQTEIKNRDAVNLAQSITYLPGVSSDHYASRGQSGIYLRGFDTREVPLYLDGIPIYIPYDGQLDFSRFVTSDISEVQVAKGYSSALMGPNAMGGAVNLVTREPQNKLEGEASIGTGSGDMLDSALHLGSRWKHFFARGSIDWLQSESYPISGNFALNPVTQTSYDRTNSYQRDERFGGRFGWTPRGQDEYVFSYTNQKANYGAPPYAGSLPTCLNGNSTNCDSAKFWKWPVWDKESYYFISNTGLGEKGSLKLRAYYDRYPTITDMYDDQTYSTMTKPNKTGISDYDDHTDGMLTEFTTRILPQNLIGASFFFKDDTHKEQDTLGGSTTALPWLADRDQVTSFAVQDAVTVSSRLRVTAGFSADHQDGLQAQTAYNNQIVAFTCAASPSGDSYSNCTAHYWSYNPSAAASFLLTKSDSLYATFSDKSRFAMIKERYSSRFGQAIPNPDLGPERARNWTFGYSHAFARRTVVQADLFRSDIRDAIENVTVPSWPVPCQGGACKVFVNVGKEVREGLEFTIRSTPLSRLTLDANYSYLNRSIGGSPAALLFDGLSTTLQPAYVVGTPKHKTVGTATLRLPHQILCVTTARYESGTLSQSDGSGSPPSPASKFATMDLGGIFPIRAGVSLQGGVRNLFDRNYWYQNGYPEEGRNWYFTMRYQF